MDVSLKILIGKHAGKELRVPGPAFLIGRSESCQLRIGSDKISRRHCLISIVDAGVFIEDFGSRNGTFVNEQRISEKVLLRSGDRLRVGNLEFEVQGAGADDDTILPGSSAPKAAASGDSSPEDSIAEWLGKPSLSSGSTVISSASETQALHVGDTDHSGSSGDSAGTTPAKEEKTAGKPAKHGAADKTAGKLPKVPKGPTAKDSTEAAAAILRKMVNRR